MTEVKNSILILLLLIRHKLLGDWLIILLVLMR